MKLLIILAISLYQNFANPSKGSTVLICTGNSSYAYHSGNCQGLKQCRAEIEKVTLEEAKRLKRKACGYCYKNSGSSNSVYSSPSGSSISSQCRATTKKGTRCSRNAKSGGYCWQHG